MTEVTANTELRITRRTARARGRDDLADDGEAHRDEPARADALDGPEGDQHRQVLGQAAEHRADEEDDDGDPEDPGPPVDVAELAEHRRRHRLEQQVGRHDPGEVLEAAEIADDRRERRRDDRRVEAGEREPGDESADDPQDLAVAEGGGERRRA